MRLIDEIEAAAKAATESVIDDNAEYDDARAAMLLLRANRLWPRIRAALLAGEEMAQQIGHDYDTQHESADRFRAATEGTKLEIAGQRNAVRRES